MARLCGDDAAATSDGEIASRDIGDIKHARATSAISNTRARHRRYQTRARDIGEIKHPR
jgi:hypothetical protein